MMKRTVCVLLIACLLASALPAMAADLSSVMCVTNCSEWVSLREYPDSSSKRLAQVRLGELVTQCSESYDGFIECEFNGKTGYIQSKYLKTTDFSPDDTFPGNQMVVNVSEWASLWDAPETGARRLAQVPVGTIVTSCVNEDPDYVYCEYNANGRIFHGYIATAYLKKANYSVTTQNEKAASISADIDGVTMTVVNCQDWVSLREKASASSARLAKVPLGAEVTDCRQVSEQFIYCRYQGVYGYIQSQYLSAPVSVTTLPETAAVTAPAVTAVADEAGADEGETHLDALPELPAMSALSAVGDTILMETYQGYTIVVQRETAQYEHMLGVCYDVNGLPLWQLSARSANEASEVRQLDAFVAGTIEEPLLIWYISGIGLYAYTYGPTQSLKWFLPASMLDITNAICHTEDYDGTIYVAFDETLLCISMDGELLWRTDCGTGALYAPFSIEIDEDGLSVLYDNQPTLTDVYGEARFTRDGQFVYTTQRILRGEA